MELLLKVINLMKKVGLWILLAICFAIENIQAILGGFFIIVIAGVFLKEFFIEIVRIVIFALACYGVYKVFHSKKMISF